MSEAIQEKKSFEQRMMDRIRDSIGDLMPDADLKKIVELGIDKAFFERPKFKRGWDTEEAPSVADKIISAQFQARVDEAINQWIASHEPEVKEAVDRAMSRGIGACLMTALDQRFQGLFASGLEQMYQQGILKRPGT